MCMRMDAVTKLLHGDHGRCLTQMQLADHTALFAGQLMFDIVYSSRPRREVIGRRRAPRAGGWA